jgi:hypothetical protein
LSAGVALDPRSTSTISGRMVVAEPMSMEDFVGLAVATFQLPL